MHLCMSIVHVGYVCLYVCVRIRVFFNAFTYLSMRILRLIRTSKRRYIKPYPMYLPRTSIDRPVGWRTDDWSYREGYKRLWSVSASLLCLSRTDSVPACCFLSRYWPTTSDWWVNNACPAVELAPEPSLYPAGHLYRWPLVKSMGSEFLAVQ